jgi:DNA-directed RNA polymerase specialized sigma24 family protein
MTVPGANSTDVKPLTKRKKETRELYARRPEAELQIGKVLSLEPVQIYKLLKNRQRDAADYLLDETIVYLLRAPRAEENFREILYAELNRRIWKLLKKFYARFNNPADFEDFGQKIEIAILKKIFDFNSDSADYAQVNFGDFVIKTAKVAWRGELVKIEREKEIFYTTREGDDEDNSNPIENSLKSNDALTDYTMMLKEGLTKLPPHIMLVAELLLDGWQIESKDEREPTISNKLDVSSRTIRNWLKEARAILGDYKAEVRK